MLENKNVIPKLNELDALINSARKRKQARRGTTQSRYEYVNDFYHCSEGGGVTY